MAEGPALGNIVKEGWLQKRGEHIRNWRPRYFILFDTGDLMGFKIQPEPNNYRNPLNKFTVRGSKIISIDKCRLYSFTIRGLQWTTIIERNFSVDTEKERETWVSAIRLVADLLASGFEGAEAEQHSPMEVAGGSGLGAQCHMGPKRMEKRRITVEHFELLKVLGRGTFGKVLLAREKDTQKVYAMKVLSKNNLLQKDEVAHTITENHVLKKTDHPFLTKLKYSFATSDQIFFVMDFLSGGELYQHLIDKHSFTEERARFYAAEIVSGIGYLHSEGIIYRDLKLENLLLDKDGHIKLADFGLCKVNITYGSRTKSFCGTPEYLAPEVLDDCEYGPAVDWWGMGVVLYEMICGRLPFFNKDHDMMFALIMKEEVRLPRSLPAATRSILSGLLTKDPTLRLGCGPTDVQEIMQHPFFAPINWSDLVAKKIPPPWKPELKDETDTRYFDTEFTEETVDLTSPGSDCLPVGQEDQFPEFSYQDTVFVSTYYDSIWSLASHT